MHSLNLFTTAATDSQAAAHEKRYVAADFGGQLHQPLGRPMDPPGRIRQPKCGRRIARTAAQTRGGRYALYQRDTRTQPTSARRTQLLKCAHDQVVPSGWNRRKPLGHAGRITFEDVKAYRAALTVQPRRARSSPLNAWAKFSRGALTLPLAGLHSERRTSQKTGWGRTAMSLLRRHGDKGGVR